MPEEPVPACAAGAELLFHWQAQRGEAGSRGPAGEGVSEGRNGMSSGPILRDPSMVFWPVLVRLNWGLGKVGLAAESLDTNAGMGGCSGDTNIRELFVLCCEGL